MSGSTAALPAKKKKAAGGADAEATWPLLVAADEGGGRGVGRMTTLSSDYSD